MSLGKKYTRSEKGGNLGERIAHKKKRKGGGISNVMAPYENIPEELARGGARSEGCKGVKHTQNL